MSIDAKATFGPDEPPLRRLTQVQASVLGAQQTSLNDAVPDVDLQSPPPTSHAEPSSKNTENLIAPLTPIAHSSPSTPRNIQLATNLPAPSLSPRLAPMNAVSFHLQRVLSDQVSPVRLAGHFAVVVIAAVVLLVSQMEMPNWNLTLPRTFPTSLGTGGTMSTVGAVTQVGQVLENRNGRAQALGGSSLQKAIVPFTIIPEEPIEGIRTYIVASGDTVLGIANKFGLKPESIQWANPSLELNPDLLRIGDQLAIPPVDGAIHTVRVGDTLSSIAAKYKVDMQSIIQYAPNNLVDASSALSVGTRLVIPNGVKPYVAPQVFAYTGVVPAGAAKGSGAFVWPTSGSVTQQFWSGHKAIDIGSWTGAPVKAADTGHVVVAQPGWNNGYGNFVVIEHGNGFASLYAHLNSIYVRAGENVAAGQQIGTVGNTGNSTGPHLHLEIRYQDAARNPFSYLR